jgi:hypothetical protein
MRSTVSFLPYMTSNIGTTDATIRAALHRQRLNHFRAQPKTLVIDELGLAHARSRVDVAVINGCIHGYEIKSAKDSLNRLPSQIDVYRAALQKVTIVAASRHLDGVLVSVPSWCGVIEAVEGPNGGLRLRSVRPARMNPDLNPTTLAQLLWRPEVHSLLCRLGFLPKELRLPRQELYAMLSEALTPREITASIREFMMQRQAWRDHPTLA